MKWHFTTRLQLAFIKCFTRSINLGGLLLFLFASLFRFQVEAKPSCDQLRQKWYSHYIQDFKISWDTNKFICPGSEGDLGLAFYDLENLKFEMNQDGYAPDFYAMVMRDVKKTVYKKDCNSMARGSSDGTLILCPGFFEDDREDRASTLVHEARHMERDDPMHVDCSKGKFKGNVRACDQKFLDGVWGGSGFNADIFFYNWVLEGSKRNELSNSVIRAYMRNMIPDRFNEITAKEIKIWRAK